MPSKIILIENSDSKERSIKCSLSVQFPNTLIQTMGNDLKALNFFAACPMQNVDKTLIVIDLDLSSLDGIGFMESFSRTAHYKACRIIIVSETGDMRHLNGAELPPKLQLFDRKQARKIRELIQLANSLKD